MILLRLLFFSRFICLFFFCCFVFKTFLHSQKLSIVAHKNKKNIMHTRLEKQMFHCLCVQISEAGTWQKVYLYKNLELLFFFFAGVDFFFYFSFLAAPLARS